MKYSSFYSVEKILEEIVERCLENKALKKLLYYTDKNALYLPELTFEQSHSLIGTCIKTVPQIDIEPDAKPYLIISLDNFIPVEGAPGFRDISLSVDILCPYQYWNLNDFKLRPYTIAGEIDSMISNFKLGDNGVADFIGAKQLVLNEHIGGCTLQFFIQSFYDRKSI